MAITVAQLKTFLAVERAGSIKGAAADLVVTQPSVSGAMAALERELGTKLLRRRGRGVVLTEAGAAFAPYASRVLGLLEEGRGAAREAAEFVERELRVVAVNTAGEYILPQAIRAFRIQEPRVKVKLEVSNRAGVLRRLELREADLGVGGSPLESRGLVGVPFLENEHVVISAPDHPLVDKQEISADDLGRETWLMRERGSGTRGFVESLLASWGVRPSTLTIGSNGAIKQSVRAGLGISMQSRWSVELELRMGLLAVLDIQPTVPSRRWYALYLEDGFVRPAVESFIEFLASSEVRCAIESAVKITSS
jgi:DNA-binding transcriptional LysR family regulator